MLPTKLTFLSYSIVLVLFLGVTSCNKNAKSSTDEDLYEMSKTTTGFSWYKNSSELLEKSAGSGHPQPFLRTRFNQTAATQLDSIGIIKTDAVFPEGSLIVKELLQDASSLERFAILYKDSDNEDADDRGWVWGYLDEDGKVAEPASKKGSSCINCHLQADNIDYMLMNKYFP